MIQNLLTTLISWLIIFPVLFGLGSLFRSFVKAKDKVLSGTLTLGIGLALLSFSLLVLDFFGWLSPIGVWVLLGVLFVLCHKSFTELKVWLQALKNEYAKPAQGFPFFFTAIGIVGFIGLLFGTLTPEIGGDALCYHLYNPKLFLKQGSLKPFDFDLTSYFPLLMNNLYLIGLATGGVFAAKLFHFLTGLLTFLVLERVLFRETKSKSLSLFTGLAFLLTPGIYNQLSTTYIDIGLAFYTLLAIVVLKQAFDSKDRKTYYLAGFFMGCAISIKYIAMMSGVGIALIWFLRFITDKKRAALLSHFGAWMFGVILSGHVWLLRNAILTKNPFFPYFGEFFGGANRPPADYFDMGYGKDPLSFLFVFWNMFMDPNAFGAFSNRIGIVYCLLLPFVFIALWKSKAARDYGIYFFVFLLLWFLVVQNDRWLYPILPTMALLGGWGLYATRQLFKDTLKRKLRKIAAALGFGILGVYLLGGIYHYRFAYHLFLGQSMESYLTDMQRTYPVATWINRNLPDHAKVLIDGEPSKFYLDPVTIYEGLIEWQLKYNEKGWNLEAYDEFIRSLGITHVLIGDGMSRPFETWDTLIRRWVQTDNVELIKEMNSKNIRDEVYWYKVYEVKERNQD